MATTSAENTQSNIVDMASVLARIQALENDKSSLSAELQQKDAKIEKLTESKRAEMQQMLETTISAFLTDLQPKDVKAVEEVKSGLERCALKGTDNPIWDVVACASAAHAVRVNELETLRVEVNAFREKEKQLQGGMFSTEGARTQAGSGNKRKSDDISSSTTDNGVPDIFEEFTRNIIQTGGTQGIFTE